jgi:hypothetical protein
MIAECPKCEGSGRIGFNRTGGSDPQQEDDAPCSRCNGEGGIEVTPREAQVLLGNLRQRESLLKGELGNVVRNRNNLIMGLVTYADYSESRAAKAAGVSKSFVQKLKRQRAQPQAVST